MKPAALPQRRRTHAGKTLVVISASLARSGYAVMAWPIGTAIIAGISPESAVLAGNADLTARFGISHPVLRESVKVLAVKGLLATRMRVGARVCRRDAWNMSDPDVLAWHLGAGIDRRFLRDFADIRLAMEPHAAALAAARRREQDIS